jgi:hypothetical protein
MYRRIRTLFPEKVNSFEKQGKGGAIEPYFSKRASPSGDIFRCPLPFHHNDQQQPLLDPVRGWYRAGSRGHPGRVGWGVEKEIGTFYVYFTLFYFLTRQSGFPYKEVAIKFQSIGKTRPPAGGEAHVGEIWNTGSQPMLDVIRSWGETKDIPPS